MSCIRVQTPGRLHFGLLGWDRQAQRQFGGVGLLVREPAIVLHARPSDAWRAIGPFADRVLHVAHILTNHLQETVTVQPLEFEVERAPAPHTGLGTGTQLDLAVARAMTVAAGRGVLAATELARMTGRGLRSGVGIHGFDHGGIVVDGGRGPRSIVPPLVARHPFPTHWKIVIVVLPLPPGRHGAGEVDAFRQLPDVPAREIDVLSRLVLLGLLPAVVEADLPAFGAALDELQTRVGRLFAPAQGGLLGHQNLEAIARRMREAGLHGVGQSSWGPALYGFTDKVSEQEASLTAEIELLHTLGGGSVVWTQAATHGAVCTVDGTDVAMPQFS